MGIRHSFRVAAFKLFQRFGIHIVPNHFYEPIPDTQRIPADFWNRPSELAGIDMNEAGQLNLLDEFCARYKKEFDELPREKTSTPYRYYLTCGSFESVDAEILYSMIREFKPRIVLEVGSGNSTLLSAQALLENCKSAEQNGFELIAVEPLPNETLKRGFPGLTRLVSSPVQQLPLSEFEKLGPNDILFIDSSHVLKTASDVQYEYLEILPRLKPGVIVHFHDIFLPNPYPKAWVTEELRFWNEQSVLQAFLAFNNAFRIIWAGSFMSLRHPDRLQAAFSSYRPGKTHPGSFWVRKIA